VVAQVALSLVLLIAAGLLVRALQQTSQIDPGFATDHRIYVRLLAAEPDFTSGSATQLFSRLLDDARGLPGVRDATLSFDVLGFMDSECATAGRDLAPARASINVIEPNYFQMLHVPLVRGRNFAATDRPQSPRVVIVNETMARRLWPGQDAVGKTVWMGCGNGQTRIAGEVIAVAGDSKYGSLDERTPSFFYVSRHQVWWNGFFALILHTTVDPHTMAGPLIQLARGGGPNLRMYEIRTFDELIEQSLWRVRWQAGLLSAFGALAIGLSVIGLYAVVAYSVTQRTREIGVRMALGAQKGDVQWMVLAHGLRLTAVGVLVGLAMSVAAMPLLRGFLYGVSPSDPVAFGGAALSWIAIALAASYFPARRASRLDPTICLRYE
jgi:predicted permease